MSHLESSVNFIIAVLLIVTGIFIMLFRVEGWSKLLAILFVFLGAFGAILFSMDSARQQELLRLKSEDIAKLSMKIAELNQQIAGSVTGGDSFCYLFPIVSFGKSNIIDFNLNHKGEYPVYDVSIRVWDETCLKQIDYGKIFKKHLGYERKEVAYDEWLKMRGDQKFITQNTQIENDIKEQMHRCIEVQEEFATITPNMPTNIMDLPLFSCAIPQGVDLSTFSHEYDVDIVARNGQYKQKIIVDVRNKRCHIYSKVEKIISNSQRIVIREYESVDSEVFMIKLLK